MPKDNKKPQEREELTSAEKIALVRQMQTRSDNPIAIGEGGTVHSTASYVAGGGSAHRKD